MSVKLVVGILLLVAVLLAGPAQAPKVVIIYNKDIGPTQAAKYVVETPNPNVVDIPALSAAQAFAFDIDDIDSSDVQSVQATTDYAAQLAAPFIPGGATIS